MVEETQLPYTINRYKGIILRELSKVGNDFSIIYPKKEAELIEKEGARSVELFISQGYFHIMDGAAKLGFQIHHATKDYVLMTKWIDQSGPSKIPNFCHHYVGVGGLTLTNDLKKILLIQEQNSTLKNTWKLPGGLVDPGETFGEGVIREVREETGV